MKNHARVPEFLEVLAPERSFTVTRRYVLGLGVIRVGPRGVSACIGWLIHVCSNGTKYRRVTRLPNRLVKMCIDLMVCAS